MLLVWIFFLRTNKKVYENKPKKKTVSCKNLKEGGKKVIYKLFLFLFCFILTYC